MNNNFSFFVFNICVHICLSLFKLDYLASDIKWPIFVFSQEGRIGNCLNAYATAYAMQLEYPNATFGLTSTTYLPLKNLLHHNTLNKIAVFGNLIIFKDYLKLTINHLLQKIFLKVKI